MLNSGSNQKLVLDLGRDETLRDRGFFRSLLKPDSFYFYENYGGNRSLKANTSNVLKEHRFVSICLLQNPSAPSLSSVFRQALIVKLSLNPPTKNRLPVIGAACCYVLIIHFRFQNIRQAQAPYLRFQARPAFGQIPPHPGELAQTYCSGWAQPAWPHTTWLPEALHPVPS
jgi:hypothetical protein